MGGLRQLQHYRGQLARDAATQLKQLAVSQPAGDSGARLQRERLQDEFTRVLENFEEMVSRGVMVEGELELRKTSLEAQHPMSSMLRCHGQETHLILQSTTMPTR